MKKFLMVFGVGLLVLIIAVVVGVGFFIGPVIKMGLETVGPKITKVPIKVEAVNVSVLTGSAQIKGLVIGNPAGYKTPEAIRVGNASVSLDPLSVFSDKIVVRSVRVESPEISYEGGLKGNNLGEILNSVNALAKAGGPADQGTSPGSKPEPGKKADPKIEVGDFLITGAKARVSLQGLTSGDMTVSLPDIHLTDLGKGSDGITPTELVSAIMNKITGATVDAAAGSVADTGKVLQELGKDVEKQAGEQLETINKSLGDLFGK